MLLILSDLVGQCLGLKINSNLCFSCEFEKKSPKKCRQRKSIDRNFPCNFLKFLSKEELTSKNKKSSILSPLDLGRLERHVSFLLTSNCSHKNFLKAFEYSCKRLEKFQLIFNEKTIMLCLKNFKPKKHKKKKTKKTLKKNFFSNYENIPNNKRNVQNKINSSKPKLKKKSLNNLKLKNLNFSSNLLFWYISCIKQHYKKIQNQYYKNSNLFETLYKNVTSK